MLENHEYRTLENICPSYEIVNKSKRGWRIQSHPSGNLRGRAGATGSEREISPRMKGAISLRNGRFRTYAIYIHNKTFLAKQGYRPIEKVAFVKEVK
jgi:hypothetical protein